jgi:hypothetical protein
MKLTEFLHVVKSNGRNVPSHVWGEEIRRALSDNLIKIGWGGALELTDAGRTALQREGE